MEKNMQITDAYKAALKKKAMPWMPKNYDDVAAQRNILNMIVAAVPAANNTMIMAETNTWPRVQNKSLPMIQAVGKIAVEVNKAIGSAPLESLNLETYPTDVLLKAWVALDYYAYLLLADYSANIRALRDRLLQLLWEREQNPAASIPMAVPQPPVRPEEMKTVMVDREEDEMKTVMVSREPEEMKTVMVSREPEEMKTVMVSREEDFPVTAPVRNMAPVQTPVESVVETPPVKTGYIDQPKKKPLKLTPALMGIIAVVVAVAILGVVMISRQAAIDKVEETISAIGTVTMESLGAIEAAEVQYAELPDGSKEKVENYSTLQDARAEYDRMSKAIDDTISAINSIKTPVTLDSKAEIEKARKLYDALKADGTQSYVTNYQVLTGREEAYTELYNEACAHELFNLGTTAYENDDYQKALEYFDEVIRDYSETSYVTFAITCAGDASAAMAQELYDDGDYEGTMIALRSAQEAYGSTESLDELMEKLVNKLQRNRPANGKKFTNKTAWGYGKMIISAEGGDLCVKLTSVSDPSQVVCYFIREGDKVSISLKDGDYKLQYAFGEYWYGTEAMFGADGTYRKMNQTFSLNTEKSGRTVYYEYYEFSLKAYSSNGSETNITRESF